MGETSGLNAVRSDGSTLPVDVGLSPIMDAGTPLVIASVHDLTSYQQLVTERRQHERAIAAERERLFRATMATVQDLCNNTLNQLQLIRTEIEEHVSPETLEQFDEIVSRTATELKVLADVEVPREVPSGIGTGIDYKSDGTT